MLRKHLVALTAGVFVTSLAFVAVGIAGEGKSCSKAGYTKQAKQACSAKAELTGSKQAKSASAKKSGCFWNSKAALASSGCSAACASKASSAKACCASVKGAKFQEAKIRRHESQRMVVAGNLACGKCLLGTTEKCVPFLLTAKGNYYRLHKNNRLKDMGQLNVDKGFEIHARVKKMDGTKYLQVESYRVL
jgi:hypothetical protein